MPASLDIRNARLPVDIQQIHLLHGNVAQSMQLTAVPNNLVYAGAGLQLLPHSVAIGLLKLVLLQNAGHNGAEHGCLCLVPFLSWQDIGLWVALHGIRMLAHDHIV